jgi:superoxide dismutase, Cu-Zn family
MLGDRRQSQQAVACFKESTVKGEVVATQDPRGVTLTAFFTDLPAGEHGFHIHRAGDLRGEGCAGACEHFHRGPPSRHGGAPGKNHFAPRHTGDLGNIVAKKRYTFFLHRVSITDLLGRSAIVHADPDDLGLGDFPDSATTGHSGARIGCAIFGRSATCAAPATRRVKRSNGTRRVRSQKAGGLFHKDPRDIVKDYRGKDIETIEKAIVAFETLLTQKTQPISDIDKKGIQYIISQLTNIKKTKTYIPITIPSL